jgi:hypothetical protein
MKKLAVLVAAALIGLGSIASTGVEAGDRRNGGAVVAAGIVGLAAGAMLGAAASNAAAAPAYGHTYAPTTYRTTRVVRSYEYEPEVYEEVYVPPPAYRRTRVVHTYESYRPRYYSGGPSVSVGFGFGPRTYGW